MKASPGAFRRAGAFAVIGCRFACEAMGARKRRARHRGQGPGRGRGRDGRSGQTAAGRAATGTPAWSTADCRSALHRACRYFEAGMGEDA